MLKYVLISALVTISAAAVAQTSYEDSIKLHISNYVQKHEVVKNDDKKNLRFFEVDPAYRVTARFEMKDSSSWFLMPTSGPMKKLYRVYGVVYFTINNTAAHLNIYQSQGLLESAEYKDYLFLPFTDASTGKETYQGGRYIDLKIEDIKGNQVVIDFNKAYNPYCAYISGRYNCPIPPKENNLSMPINAGEKAYAKE